MTIAKDKPRYFLISDMGYDGISMQVFNSSEKAILELKASQKSKPEEPMILIKGILIENYKWVENIE